MNPNRSRLLFFYLIIVALFTWTNFSFGQICSVNAGLDRTICVNQQPITLIGTVGTSQANPVSYLWTKLAGPAAIISSPTQLSTSISGLTPGNYVFQLSNK